MAGQLMTAVIGMIRAIPPTTSHMALDVRWRALSATLWLATLTYAALRAASWLRPRRPQSWLIGASIPVVTLANAHNEKGQEPSARPLVLEPVKSSTPPSKPSSPKETGPTPRRAPIQVPLPVVIIAVVVGAVMVALTSLVLRAKPQPKPDSAKTPLAAAATPPDTALDVRWKSGRMQESDCIGTFEVTQGTGARAQFVASVMDTSGAVIARDSARVASAVRGLLVDFRFARVDCKAIDDWQLQVTTPKTK